MGLLEEQEDIAVVTSSFRREWREVMTNLFALLCFIAWNVCPVKHKIWSKVNFAHMTPKAQAEAVHMKLPYTETKQWYIQPGTIYTD